MNTRRSYLDNVNAGRQRRPEPRFEDLDRTLAGLEGRSDRRTDAPRAFDPPHPASRHEFAERPAPRPDDSRQRGYTSPRDLRDLARDMDTSRRQEEGLSSIGRIAGELKAMREELRQQMGTGLRREFDSLRGDLQRVAQVARSGQGSELSAEFDRLSDAVRQLSERSDDKSVNMLRLEVNQLKDALETLAREDTVRSADRRWDEFDRKWNQLETRLAGNARSDDSAVGGLKSQLADIGKVLNGLPDTGLLRSMEERLQKLAGSIEQFGRHSDSMPAAFSLIEQRLDEITRAIAATATPTAHFDPQPFERVEARISALAHQIDELVEDQSSHVVIDRLNVLSQRVDDIAQRVEIPEIVVDRLASQIAAISEQIERRPGGELPSALIHGIEDRFEQLADMVDRRQGDASEQGRMLFREMERRLDEVAQRLEERQHHNDSAPLMAAIDERFADLARRMERQGGPDRDAIESLELRLEDISKRIERAGQPERNMIAGLETRLEEISRRIEVSARQSGGIDPEIVRNLESQVASLTSHLAQPSQVLPEFEDIGPRLAHIERSLTSQRDSILDAAR